jgi:hypothetical protein
MKPMLKAPGTKRLKLYNDEPPSNVAFKFNSRRYTTAMGLLWNLATRDVVIEHGGVTCRIK